jgi:hypothetical protein
VILLEIKFWFDTSFEVLGIMPRACSEVLSIFLHWRGTILN